MIFNSEGWISNRGDSLSSSVVIVARTDDADWGAADEEPWAADEEYFLDCRMGTRPLDENALMLLLHLTRPLAIIIGKTQALLWSQSPGSFGSTFEVS